METYNDLIGISESFSRDLKTRRIIKSCFDRDECECQLDLAEYLDTGEMVVYMGFTLAGDPWGGFQVESSKVPEEYLNKYVSLLELKEDCLAWLRTWNSVAPCADTFEQGLPGESNEFSCPSLKQEHLNIKRGEAFDFMEGQIYAKQLLE